MRSVGLGFGSPGLNYTIHKCLSPLFTAFVARLAVAQVVKTFPASYGTWRLISIFTKASNCAVPWATLVLSTRILKCILLLSCHVIWSGFIGWSWLRTRISGGLLIWAFWFTFRFIKWRGITWNAGELSDIAGRPCVPTEHIDSKVKTFDLILEVLDSISGQDTDLSRRRFFVVLLSSSRPEAGHDFFVSSHFNFTHHAHFTILFDSKWQLQLHQRR